MENMPSLSGRFLPPKTNLLIWKWHIATITMAAQYYSLAHQPFPLLNIARFTCFAFGFIFRHLKINLIQKSLLKHFKVQHCFVLKCEVARIKKNSNLIELHEFKHMIYFEFEAVKCEYVLSLLTISFVSLKWKSNIHSQTDHNVFFFG